MIVIKIDYDNTTPTEYVYKTKQFFIMSIMSLTTPRFLTMDTTTMIFAKTTVVSELKKCGYVLLLY